MLYRVRWKNYSSEDDTWEPEAHLDDCREVLLAYKKALSEIKPKKDSGMVRLLRCIHIIVVFLRTCTDKAISGLLAQVFLNTDLCSVVPRSCP